MAALALLLAAFAAAASTGTVTLAAAGDIRLDGPIAAVAKSGGPEAPSAEVRHLLEADIVHGNLETPVTTRGKKTDKTWNFRAHPRLLPILRAAGFTVLTIANNHVWDYGLEGFLDTVAAVKKGGWVMIGGGKDRAEAEKVRVVVKNGVKVGFVGLTSTNPKEGWAKPGKPGVAYSDFTRVAGVVAAAKQACDVLVVSFHGGTELAEDPNDIQKAVAHAAVDAGADLFLGHHPHVLQPVEVYKGKPIVYSLGNFLFVSPTPSTRPTVVARATLAADGVRRLEFHPVDGNWGRLKPAPNGGEVEAAARAALDRLGAFSAHPELLSFVPTGPGS
ncbi:MAG: CapA family protein [Elusimicrobiota bacterium]|nr:CapA family protein [Elusimicrobiota bacterium]